MCPIINMLSSWIEVWSIILLHLTGGVLVSNVDATGDWVHLASLVEMIKGIKQSWINHMPFYLRGLVRMVPMTQLHGILPYAALTDSKTNLQVGIDASAYIWVRARRFLGHCMNMLVKMGTTQSSKRMDNSAQLSPLCSVILKFSRQWQLRTLQYTRTKQLTTSSCHWIDIQLLIEQLTSFRQVIKFCH